MLWMQQVNSHACLHIDASCQWPHDELRFAWTRMKHGKDKKGRCVCCTLCSLTTSDGLLRLLSKPSARAHTHTQGDSHDKDIVCTVCMHMLFSVCLQNRQRRVCVWGLGRKRLGWGSVWGFCRVVLFMASSACTTGNPLNTGKSVHRVQPATLAYPPQQQ